MELPAETSEHHGLIEVLRAVHGAQQELPQESAPRRDVYPLLSRSPQAVCLGHLGHLVQQHGSVAEGQKDQRGYHLRAVYLPERPAQVVYLGRGHQQEGRHETEHSLEHQRDHGDHSSGYVHAAYAEQRRPVKKRVQETYCRHQRYHVAQLRKAGADRYERELIADQREYHHEQQSRDVIFVEGSRDEDVDHRHQELGQRAQPVVRRVHGRELVHGAQIQHSSLRVIHSSSSFPKK